MGFKHLGHALLGMIHTMIGSVHTKPKRVHSHNNEMRVLAVNSVIHSYITHTFSEDMYWVQCMLRRWDPSIESNRTLDKMEWLIEDFKLFLCRKFGISDTNLPSIPKEVEEMCIGVYPDFKKNVSLVLLDSYVSHIHSMFSCLPLEDIRSFHPSLFDHDLCFHDWNRPI